MLPPFWPRNAVNWSRSSIASQMPGDREIHHHRLAGVGAHPEIHFQRRLAGMVVGIDQGGGDNEIAAARAPWQPVTFRVWPAYLAK